MSDIPIPMPHVACCAFLRSRAMHSLRIEAQLRRQPLPDLLGQLHLQT